MDRPKSIITYSRKGQSVSGLPGITNINFKCYINSSLQIFLQTNELTSFFEKSHLDDHCDLSHHLEIFISAMKYPSNLKYYNPAYLFNAIFRTSDFPMGTQQDAHEFVIYFLNQLNVELNSNKSAAPLAHRNFVVSEAYGNLSIEAGTKIFWDIFKVHNETIIVDLFFGLISTTMVCTQCGFTSRSFEEFNCLSLPINDFKCTVQESLDLFFATEVIERNCPKCNNRLADKIIY